MKVALAQINPTVGDVQGNLLLVEEAVKRAKTFGVDLLVFPELALVGYPPRDLLFQKEMIVAVEKALAEKVAPMSKEVAIIIGAPLMESEHIYNSALFFKEGRLEAKQDKTLLPNYDVFDEMRYFQAASERKPFLLDEAKVGITICEDAWNDKDFWQRRMYDIDPVEEQVKKGADFIINISASPYHYGKRRFRAEMLAHSARKYKIPVLFVNQVGGNDELIFDGSSMVFDRDGKVVLEGKRFEEDFLVVNLDKLPSRGKLPEEIVEDISCIHDALVLGVRDYLRKTGFKKAVVGLSGGIDSSVTAALAAEALGPENVVGVIMPSRYSSRESVEDAQEVARNLGIETRIYSIEQIFLAYLKTLNPSEKPMMDTAEENVQARIRGNILMFISNREGVMVLSTGNKSEIAVGYCTLYGDMSGGLDVLSDVPKMMVYELARYLNRERTVIPERVILKAPSAELRPGQKDEDALPPYRILDSILKSYVEENKSVEEIVRAGFDRKLVEDVIRRVDWAEFKRRQAAPGLKVTTKAFGVGRRMPIAWKKGW